MLFISFVVVIVILCMYVVCNIMYECTHVCSSIREEWLCQLLEFNKLINQSINHYLKFRHHYVSTNTKNTYV